MKDKNSKGPGGVTLVTAQDSYVSGLAKTLKERAENADKKSPKPPSKTDKSDTK